MYVNSSVEFEKLSKKEIHEKLDIYEFVGYTAIVLNFKYSPTKQYQTILQEIQEITTLNLFGKIILHPKTIKDLKKSLGSLKIPPNFLVCVQSTDKDLLTFSINDSRIDCIAFPHVSELSFLTPGIVSLLKSNKKYIEISLKDMLRNKIRDRSRLFHEMAKFLDLMSTCTNLILYGGCEETIYEIRGPHEIASIFNAIFEVPKMKSKSMNQSNPEQLISELQTRGKYPHLPRGVKIVTKQNKE